MKEVVIVGTLRAPISRFQGALACHPAAELGSMVVKALLGHTGVDVHTADEVILGQVLITGAGQNPARQSAINGGLLNTVSIITTNGVCGSDLRALHLVTQAIRCGETNIVIAGGQENMSRTPRVLTDSRTGAQLGSSQLVDNLVHDGLWDAFNDYHMGVTAENLTREYGIGRELQDTHALHPQHKTQMAIDTGCFKDEIVPVIAQRNGRSFVVDIDERPRTDASAEGLTRLDPTLDRLGSVTAGDTSSVNNGTATVMVVGEAKAQELNLPALARIHAFASVGVDPTLMEIAPVYATHRCLERVGQQLVDADLIEASEAFTAQALSVEKMLEWDERRMNMSGGAITLGYPIGASGCRILVSLVHEMVKRRAYEGLVILCIGDGQGVALAIE